MVLIVNVPAIEDTMLRRAVEDVIEAAGVVSDYAGLALELPVGDGVLAGAPGAPPIDELDRLRHAIGRCRDLGILKGNA